jgi:hypothetical protein
MQSKAAAILPGALSGRGHALPPEGKWPRRKTWLFILGASTLGWLGILSALLPRL